MDTKKHLYFCRECLKFVSELKSHCSVFISKKIVDVVRPMLFEKLGPPRIYPWV